MSNEFIIDGNTISFQPGDTIMAAVQSADYYIPHLCHHPDVSPHGSCRLCMVKVDGRFVPSCTTAATANAKVESESDELRKLRKQLLQMLFVEGNHFCPSCEDSGQCHLQGLAYALEMDDLNFSPMFPKRRLDASHPDLFLDMDRCIQCGLCVRASNEIDHKHAFIFSGRGLNTSIRANSDTGLLIDTKIQATDAAAHICPVGAILPKRGNYSHPIGSRLYDQQPIQWLGNLRPEAE